VLLVIRSKRNAEKRKQAEAKVREYEQKFNIGGMIAKLKEDAKTGNVQVTKDSSKKEIKKGGQNGRT
jgi:hypothetical protein